MDDHNCAAGEEALGVTVELGVQVRALERRVDRSDLAAVRLTERVGAVEERMADHELLTKEAVKKMSDSLGGLNETVDALKNTVEAVMSAPPVPTGVAIAESWRQTPPSVRAKIGATIVGLLASGEFVKALFSWLGQLLKHLIH